MSTLSIRKLPQELERAIIQEAKRKGQSKTEVVIRALKQIFHLGAKEDRKKKIRQFFGKMTPSAWLSFQKVTSDFSIIEKEMWK